MCYKQIALLIFTYSLLVCNQSNAQVYFDIGYGHAFGQPQDVNKTTYLFNKINSPSKDFRKIRGGNGIVFAVGLMENSVGVELKFHGIKATTKSTFEQFGILKTADIKLKRSILSLNFVYGSDKMKIGHGVDMGTLVISGRTYPSYQSDKPNYGKFVVSNAITGSKSKSALGVNIFAERKINRYVNVRATYSWNLGKGIDGSAFDYYLLGLDSFSPYGTNIKWSNFKIDFFIHLGQG